MLEWLFKKAVSGMAILALATMVLYMGDWAVWRLRSSRGTGMGQVQRSQVDVATLKGNKVEYYYGGRWMADCSRSIFPQAGEGSCWWLERHKQVVLKY